MKSKFLVGLLTALSALTVSLPASAEVSEADFTKAMDKYLTSEKGQEQLGKTIETYFQKRQRDSQKQQEEKVAADLESAFKNPVKIDAGTTSPAKGPANAKITIIEFSDFQCPFCKRGKDAMDQLLKDYPNDVRVVFKNLPLPFHDQAVPAAKAALAAGKQGKYWEMHDAMFDNQSALKPAFYTEQAQKLGLDMTKFKADMESPDIAEQIKKDKELAEKHGISGTPGFFVNGIAVRGAYPVQHFKMIIDRLLKS